MEDHSLLYSEFSSLLQELDKDPLEFIKKYQQSKGESTERQQWIELALAHAFILCNLPEKGMELCTINIEKLQNQPGSILLPFFLMLQATGQAALMQIEPMRIALEQAEERLMKPFSIYPGLAIKLLWAAYYLFVQKPVTAQIYAMRAVESLDKVKDPQISAYLFWKLGRFYERLSKYDVAIGYLTSAYDLCEQYKLKLQKLMVAIDLISVNARLGQYDKGEMLFKQASKLTQKLNLAAYEISLNLNYGLLCKIKGKLCEAIRYYSISLELMQKSGINNPAQEFSVYNNLANAYSESNDPEKALELFGKAAKIAEKIGNLDLKAQVNNNIGLTFVAMKRYDEALPLIKKAIAHYKKIRNWELLSRAIRTEAFLYQQTKQYRKGFLTMDKLDKVRSKHLLQVQNENASHSNKVMDTLFKENASLRNKFEVTQKRLEQKLPANFIGSSETTHKILDTVSIAAAHPSATVFIYGESGTGKEIVARLIHENSSRNENSFVAVNCAAISPNLFESEFFGHMKGAFTGADSNKKGYFQLADKGTLFLDEISEMPLDFQAKLLRALDSNTIMPVGKGTEISVNCRIIAATNRDIVKMTDEHTFRLDLFHRINALDIYIPPLRDRLADITDLVDYYLDVYAEETHKGKPRITENFLNRLRKYNYPGNVRELKNFIERLYILYYKPVWDADILDNIKNMQKYYENNNVPLDADLKSAERNALINALKNCGGKQSEAAKILKITESTLSRKLKRLGLKKV